MTDRRNAVRLAMPLFVLLFTRAGIELVVPIVPLCYSWIPSFAFYYASILICLLFARHRFMIRITFGSLSRGSFPGMKWFVLGFILPAMIPLCHPFRVHNTVPYYFYSNFIPSGLE